MSVSPLDGLRVLELGERGAAAFTGRLFADNGAMVTRVSAGAEDNGVDSPWPYLLRQKHLVVIENETARHSRIAVEANSTDIIISDLLPPELEVVGWDQLGDSTAAVRVALTPMGRSGPEATAPATPLTLLARSGHTFLTGDPDREPLTLPRAYVAYQAGTYAYSAALAAWLTRSDRTTEVDVCELEVLAALHQHTTVMYTYGGRLRRRRGNQYDGTYPITILPCADGWLGICITAPFWERFARWLNPAWLDDERFADSPSRWEHRDELDEAMRQTTAGRSAALLEREGQHVHRVPVGSVDKPDDLFADAHLVERAFWAVDTADNGRRVLYPGVPFIFRSEGRPGGELPTEPLTRAVP